MRTPVLAAILAIGLTAAPAGAEVIREQSRFEREAGGLTAARVENARGVVDVRPSPNDRIRITALKVARSVSPSVARELARGTVVEIEESGGQLRIQVRYPKHRVHLTLWNDLSSRSIPSVEVRLAIELPARMAALVNTASGDIATSGVAGAQRLRTASGDVTVEGAAGTIEIATASGDVTANAIRAGQIQTVSGDVACSGAAGRLWVVTTSGDIRVDGSDDSLRVKTVSGGIRLERAPRGLDLASTSGSAEVGPVSGQVSMRSVSGDLHVQLAEPLTGADISSTAGTLTVILDPGVGCALRAVSPHGEINFRVPVQARTLSRGEVSATIRGGSTPVHLRTVSGDINVMGGGR